MSQGLASIAFCQPETEARGRGRHVVTVLTVAKNKHNLSGRNSQRTFRAHAGIHFLRAKNEVLNSESNFTFAAEVSLFY